MENPFSQFLSKAGRYSEEEAMLLKEKLKIRKIPKLEALLREGEVCSAFWFVISGSIFQYSLDEDGNKTIIDLSVSSDWVVNYKSFTSRKPSDYAIEAYEDSEVYELSMDSIHDLIARSQSFLQLGGVLESATSRVVFYDNNLTPDEKYKYIMEHSPGLLQNFPLSIIASYLKITPETLSRVRKRITSM